MRQLKIERKATSKTDDVTGRYFNEITKFELLDISQEIELCEKIKAGCTASKQKLINSNLRFVVSVAKQYLQREIAIDDLIAYGNIGLIEAAERFDHTKGFKFITYAVWWIRQRIQYGISEMKNQIRLPQNQNQNRIKAIKIREDINKREQREPTIHELAKKMKVPDKEVKNILFTVFSMDSYSNPNEDCDYHGSIEDVTAIHADVPVSRKSERIYIMKILKQRLSKREIKVLTEHLGFDGDEKTLHSIGMELGISYERARQIYFTAIKKLKRTNLDAELIR